MKLRKNILNRIRSLLLPLAIVAALGIGTYSAMAFLDELVRQDLIAAYEIQMLRDGGGNVEEIFSDDPGLLAYCEKISGASGIDRMYVLKNRPNGWSITLAAFLIPTIPVWLIYYLLKVWISRLAEGPSAPRSPAKRKR